MKPLQISALFGSYADGRKISYKLHVLYILLFTFSELSLISMIKYELNFKVTVKVTFRSLGKVMSYPVAGSWIPSPMASFSGC